LGIGLRTGTRPGDLKSARHIPDRADERSQKPKNQRARNHGPGHLVPGAVRDESVSVHRLTMRRQLVTSCHERATNTLSRTSNEQVVENRQVVLSPLPWGERVRVRGKNGEPVCLSL